MDELFTEMRNTWEQMKKVIDRKDDEIKKFGEASAETKTSFDKMNERLDTLEVRFQRPAVSAKDGDATDSESKRVFETIMRKGDNGLSAAERKALSIDDNTNGGYLIPQQISLKIIEALQLISPIRQLANLETISVGNTLLIPRETSTFAAGWVAERGARAVTNNATLGAEGIPTHEVYAEPAATQQFLDDSVTDIEGWMQRKVTKTFAQIEGQAFVNGSGLGQPEGLLVNAAVQTVKSLDASLLTADGIISLFHALPEPFARNATWLMKRKTVGIVRAFKNTQGSYIWQPSYSDRTPATILGNPYLETPDMPDVVAGATPIIFGDINQGYTIVDRKGIVVIRDALTQKPLVIFYTTKRVGGQVVNPAAIVKQLISA